MNESNRRRRRPRVRTLLLLILLIVIGMSVYSYWSDFVREQQQRARELPYPEVGSRCTVIFIGEAVSSTSQPGIDNDATSAPARSASGKFRAVNEQWLVLVGDEPDSPDVWIPRERIQMIQVFEP